MADQPPTPPTPPRGPNDDKPKRKRGKLNQEYSDELDKAGRILKQAQKAAYAQLFVEQQVDPELIPGLPAKLKQAGELIAAALKGTADVGEAQDDREDFRNDLIEAIDSIRTAAKRKYRRKDPSQMKKYFVGEPLGTNRADLKGMATAVLGLLRPKEAGAQPLDTLPGISADKIEALATALENFTNPDAVEQEAQGDASGSRMTLGQLVRNIRNDRIEIQLAVDQAHPWRDPTSTDIRTVFELPLDRPLGE